MVDIKKYPFIYKYLELFPDSFDLISHRGNVGSIDSEENNVDNSLSNVKIAIKREYINAIEIDVRLVDDIVIASHEKVRTDMLDKERTDLLYYYKFLQLRSTLLNRDERLRQVYGDKLSKTDFITPLRDILEYMKENNPDMGVCLDIKDVPAKLKPFSSKKFDEFLLKRAYKISELINEYKDDLKNITVNSFDPSVLRMIKELTGVTTNIGVYVDVERTFDKFIKGNLEIDGYSIMWCYLSLEVLDRLVKYNKRINVYTIDGLYRLNYVCKKLYEYYCKTGCSLQVGLITNVPDFIHDSLGQALSLEYE